MHRKMEEVEQWLLNQTQIERELKRTQTERELKGTQTERELRGTQTEKGLKQRMPVSVL